MVFSSLKGNAEHSCLAAEHQVSSPPGWGQLTRDWREAAVLGTHIGLSSAPPSSTPTPAPGSGTQLGLRILEAGLSKWKTAVCKLKSFPSSLWGRKGWPPLRLQEATVIRGKRFLLGDKGAVPCPGALGLHCAQDACFPSIAARCCAPRDDTDPNSTPACLAPAQLAKPGPFPDRPAAASGLPVVSVHFSLGGAAQPELSQVMLVHRLEPRIISNPLPRSQVTPPRQSVWMCRTHLSIHSFTSCLFSKICARPHLPPGASTPVGRQNMSLGAAGSSLRFSLFIRGPVPLRYPKVARPLGKGILKIQDGMWWGC